MSVRSMPGARVLVKPLLEARISLPLYACGVAAGFPSPSDDYIEKGLDLNEYLIKHPSATFYARANGTSLIGRGIYDGDLLIIDRAIEPYHGCIVVAALEGELTCKILNKKRQCLESANASMQPIAISDDASLIIEGVVINSIRHHVRAG